MRYPLRGPPRLTLGERIQRRVVPIAISPFTLLDDALRIARLRILGYEEWHQAWPEPAGVTHSRRSDGIAIASSTEGDEAGMQSRLQEDDEPRSIGLFQLPLEIRMEIYALIFPFPEIHLTKSFYQGSKTSKIRLEAYPCVADWSHKEDFLCDCLLSPTEKSQRFRTGPRSSGCIIRDSRYYRVHPDVSKRLPFRGPREKGSDSGAGLWELIGIMYASKAL
jgi:hypothetical protein